ERRGEQRPPRAGPPAAILGEQRAESSDPDAPDPRAPRLAAHAPYARPSRRDTPPGRCLRLLLRDGAIRARGAARRPAAGHRSGRRRFAQVARAGRNRLAAPLLDLPPRGPRAGPVRGP